MNRIVPICVFCLLFVASVYAQNTPAWAPHAAYSVGSLATYDGVTYSCLQAHKAQTGWGTGHHASPVATGKPQGRRSLLHSAGRTGRVERVGHHQQ